MSERGDFSRRQQIREGIKEGFRGRVRSSLIAPAGLGVESAGLLLDSRLLVVGGFVIIGVGGVIVTRDFFRLGSKAFSDFRREVRENKDQTNAKDQQT